MTKIKFEIKTFAGSITFIYEGKDVSEKDIKISSISSDEPIKSPATAGKAMRRTINYEDSQSERR